MNTSFLRRLAIATTLAAGALSAHAQPYSGIVIFGDSLSDTGNVRAATGGAFPNLAEGPYFNGRFSNGPIWVDFFCSTPKLLPSFSVWRLSTRSKATPFLPTLAVSLSARVRVTLPATVLVVVSTLRVMPSSPTLVVLSVTLAVALPSANPLVVVVVRFSVFFCSSLSS